MGRYCQTHCRFEREMGVARDSVPTGDGEG